MKFSTKNSGVFFLFHENQKISISQTIRKPIGGNTSIKTFDALNEVYALAVFELIL